VKRKSTSLCLFAIPAFDRIAGLYNRYLNSSRGYANANDFEVWLRVLNGFAGNCPYLYGKRVVWKSGPGESGVGGGVGVVGVRRRRSWWGGGKCISLYEPLESLT
jgi:hypothetical protein